MNLINFSFGMMLVWGDQDDHIPLGQAMKLRDTIPNARLIVFRNCGHLPPAEYPLKFVEAVANFCQTRQKEPLQFKPRRSEPPAVAGG
jgi:pimeloyl-ACP methyl ester carboxylesterase